LLTGRTHQIRLQLSQENCPVYGDYMYGYPNQLRYETTTGIGLACYHLQFPYNGNTYSCTIEPFTKDFYLRDEFKRIINQS